MELNIIILGGVNNNKGELSNYTKDRIKKCYDLLHKNSNDINLHFSGSFRFNDTKIIHSQICCNYFNEININNLNVNKVLHTNKSTIEEALHFGNYFKNTDSKIQIITNDWHSKRVKYLFDKVFEINKITNYEIISVISNTLDKKIIQDEINKVRELEENPYGLWKEWLVNNYYMQNINLKIINKTDFDGKIIVNMRNENNNMFFNNEIFEWDSFKDIFYTKYFTNEIPPFFVWLKDEIIGFIGCKTSETNINDIGIMFFKKFQNRGLGKISLKNFLNIYDKYYYKDNKIIVAQILKTNIASYKIFTSNNFKINVNKTTNEIYYLTY